MPSNEEQVEQVFPQLQQIEDSSLARGVSDVWTDGLRRSTFDSLPDVPWSPHRSDAVSDMRLVTHINDVTNCAIRMTDFLCEDFSEEIDVDRDLVIAGALLHDVSKLFELDGEQWGEFNDLIPHPNYGVHLVAEAGLSHHLQHIVLAHSIYNDIEPVTMEAKIVEMSDGVPVRGLYWSRLGELGVNKGFKH